MKSPISAKATISPNFRRTSRRESPINAALMHTFPAPARSGWKPEPSSKSAAARPCTVARPESATPEATAYAVKFLSHQRPDSALLPKAALWLMNHRNEGYWWNSTKQTAMVIYGLTDYLKVTGELHPNLTAAVLVNDVPVLTKKLDQATALGVHGHIVDQD